MKYSAVFLIYILLVFLPSKLFPQDYWQSISSPTNELLKNISFIDSLTGWCAGRGGTIIHTTDGGTTWLVQNSNVESFIVSIFFLDENRGWALTIKDTPPFGTIILNTTNGGEHWDATVYPVENIFMNTVFFFDSLNGFLGGSKIAGTTDGGLTWHNAHIDSNMISGLPVHNFNFFNRQFGYACGGFIDLAGVVWRTTDYGLNWSATGISPDQIFDLYIIDSLNAISLSGDPEGFFGVGDIRSTDAGETWSYNILPIYALSFAIDFRTETEAWSASGFKFLYTSDKGEEWIEKPIPDSAVIYNLQFTDSSTGYAVGQNGVILKYDAYPSGINEPDISSTQLDYYLNQNYPNPFNPNTTIGFTIPNLQFTILKVYDVLGNEVETLVSEEKPKGVYEVKFNPASGIRHRASGIYFYRLTAGSFTETRKMIYLK
jgi:photosystem II stability/assembly factor-like uncharacterized protein